MKKILLPNAYEAWMEAIHYAGQLDDGICTLGAKKKFVASLHNAVELFLKQQMLNKNDHRVARVNNIDSSGEPQKSFLNATDLNLYFGNLSRDERNKFYSIEFKDLINIVNKDLFPDHTFSSPLKVLNKLRNEETHFYIKSEDYLTDQEFELFYNFMIEFYHALEDAKLMPWAFGHPHAGMEESRLMFNRLELRNFSYKKALRKSDTVKKIKELFHDDPIPWDIVSEPYSCCDWFYCTNSVENGEHVDHAAELGISFEKFLDYIYSLIECDLIHTSVCETKVADFLSFQPEIYFMDPAGYNEYGYIVEIDTDDKNE